MRNGLTQVLTPVQWSVIYLTVITGYITVASLYQITPIVVKGLQGYIFAFELGLGLLAAINLYLIHIKNVTYHCSFILTSGHDDHQSNTRFLLFDLMSIIPWFSFSFYSSNSAFSLFLFWVGILSKLYHLRVFKNIFHELEFVDKNSRFFMVILGVVNGFHLLACGWMAIGQSDPVTGESLTTHYNLALYWTVTTLTTVGYGDITPSSNLARIYTMLVMLLGVAGYGVIIGTVSKMLTVKDRYLEERREKIKRLQEFLTHHNISSELQKKVYSFYQHLISKRETDTDRQILTGLPEGLTLALKLQMKINLLSQIEIFKGLKVACLAMISNRLEEKFFSPGEIIMQKGQKGHEMYIISHGLVEIIIDGQVVAKTGAGKVFGEMALIENTIRNADVKAKDFCDLYLFNKDDYHDVIEAFPELGERFVKIYEERKKQNES